MSNQLKGRKLYQRTCTPKFVEKKLSKVQQKRIPKRAVGRPPREIDWEFVERLAMIRCTPEEIAAMLRLPNLTAITGRAEFTTVYRRGWELGKASLRRMQWRRAVEGSEKMLIFLGKQILGQREYWHGELTGENGQPIAIRDDSKPDLNSLTLEELQQLKNLVEKAGPKALPKAEEA